MSLVIRKKGNKSFFHYFTIGGTAFEYSASDLTIIIDNNKAKLRSLTGRPIALKDGYTVNQITIFDDSTGGGAETFATFILLTQRLIDLGYPAYYQDGQIILGDLISGDANNALVLGSDGKLYVSASGLLQDLQSVLDQGGYAESPNAASNLTIELLNDNPYFGVTISNGITENLLYLDPKEAKLDSTKDNIQTRVGVDDGDLFIVKSDLTNIGDVKTVSLILQTPTFSDSQQIIFPNENGQHTVATREWINQGYTVATLPSTPATGQRAHVTDATSTTFYSVVVGGGTNVVPVFYNGTNWVIA